MVAANGDDHGHGGEPLFDSHNIAPGATYELQLFDDGEFAYHCHPHPWMEANLIVEALDPDEEFRTLHVEILDGTRYDNYSFRPSTVEARVGDTVVWHNNGTQVHTVTSDDVTEDPAEEDGPAYGVVAALAVLVLIPLARRRLR